MSSTSLGSGAYVRIALGVALFFLLDSVVFRGELYLRWISPTSGLGNMVRTIDIVRSNPIDRPFVLVVGDSRVGEGFSAKLATEQATNAGSPLTFINGGVAGTSPRIWYYLLRQIREHGEKLTAVAIMTQSYHDNDLERQAERRLDILFVHPFLSLADSVSFARSFPSWPARLEATEAVAFRGMAYKNDVWDFLRDPVARVRDVDAWRKHGADWVADYGGRDASLAGLALDLASGILTVPADQSPDQQATLAAYAKQLRQYRGRPPDNAPAVAYRREWLGRIAELCQQDGARFFVFRIPRGPLHHLVDADDEPSGVLAGLARSGGSEVLSADLFNGLERPAFFFDDLHLNRIGRQIFSRELAQVLLSRLLAVE